MGMPDVYVLLYIPYAGLYNKTQIQSVYNVSRFEFSSSYIIYIYIYREREREDRGSMCRKVRKTTRTRCRSRHIVYHSLNADYTVFMCFKQEVTISILSGKLVNLMDQFT